MALPTDREVRFQRALDDFMRDFFHREIGFEPWENHDDSHQYRTRGTHYGQEPLGIEIKWTMTGKDAS